MGLFKKLAVDLGFGHHDLHEVNKEHDDDKDISGNNYVNSGEENHHHNYSNLPRKGFSVVVQVPVDRAHQIGPILVPCVAGDGGVQVDSSFEIPCLEEVVITVRSPLNAEQKMSTLESLVMFAKKLKKMKIKILQMKSGHSSADDFFE